MSAVSPVSRLVGAGFVALVCAAAFMTCVPRAGERCIVMDEDECPDGYACTIPENCSLAYCCPVSGPTDEPGCQVCPLGEGGAGTGGAAGTGGTVGTAGGGGTGGN